MAIQSNNTANGTLILISDTTLLNPTTGRAAITFASLHEQTGVGETINIFLSPDSTSAAGERIDQVVFAANETFQPVSMLLTVPKDNFLIAKGTTGSLVEANISFTQYTGSS